MAFLRMSDLDLRDKRVLIREDLNVPIDGRPDHLDPAPGRRAADHPAAREAGAAVMVLSHLGRPKEGEFDEAESLAPVARMAARSARQAGATGAPTISMASRWPPGEVVLLENCRMNVGEGKDDEALAKKYAALCDIFVMDAFGTAHRAQASTHGVITFAADRLRAARCWRPNWMRWASALENPAQPLLAIVAGSKVSTKLTLLENLIGKVDQLIVGGGIANTFIAATGHRSATRCTNPT